MLVQMGADQRDCGEQVSLAGCESSASSFMEQVQSVAKEMQSDPSGRDSMSELSGDQNLDCERSANATRIIKRSKVSSTTSRVDIRLLVRRREAGALIGKQGANIKRMREQYNSSTFNIPDTGNGPERVVCISAEGWQSMEKILLEISQLFLVKSSALNLASEDQVELKQLINSAYAGVLIGIGGQSIRKLRSDSKAAIKIYEMCCPQSDERVCAIKARPPVVVGTIRMIHEIMLASQSSIKVPLQAHKLYDALNFDLNQVDKYGGHALDDCGPQPALADLNTLANGHKPLHLFHQHHHSNQTQTTGLQHVMHYNPMSRSDMEPLPFVMSPPTMLRPGLFFSPLQQLDFAPYHSLISGSQFMQINSLNKRPRFSQRPNLPAALNQHYGTPTAVPPPHRNQRFHPYQSINDSNRVQTHSRNQNHQPKPSSNPSQSFHRPGQQQASDQHRSFSQQDGQQHGDGGSSDQQPASEGNARQSIGSSCSVVKAQGMETAQVNFEQLAAAHLFGSSEVVNPVIGLVRPLDGCSDGQQHERAPTSSDAARNLPS